MTSTTAEFGICEECGEEIDPEESVTCDSCGVELHEDCLIDHGPECQDAY